MVNAKKQRRLRKVKVSFVSLVEKGANLQPGLLKSEDDQVQIVALTKADTEGLLHSLVYVPNRLDAHGHWMSAEDVRAAAHSHMAEGAPLDIQHDCKPLKKDQARVVESFVLTGYDSRFPSTDRTGALVNHSGAWGMVIKLEDEDLLAKAMDGQLTEVSLYAAPGAYEIVDENLPLGKGHAEDPEDSTEHTMDETKLAGIIADALSKAMAPIVESIATLKEAQAAPVAKTEDQPEPSVDESGRPLFKGDINNPLAVLEHERRIEDFELATEFEGQMGNADAVQELRKCQMELRKRREKEDEELGLVAKPGRSLRKQLLEQPSNVPTGQTAQAVGFMQPSDKGAHEAILKQASEFNAAKRAVKKEAK